MHQPRLAEPHLEFLRVRVHVHANRIHFEEQHVGRMPPVVQHVAVSEPHGARDQLVPQRPSIEEEMLLVGLAAGIGRQAEPAVQAQARAVVIELERVADELVAEHGRHPRISAPLVPRRRMVGEGPSRGRQPEPDVEAAEREALDESLDLRRLRALGPQELAAGRHVEEQLAHFDGRAGRVRLGRGPGHDAVGGRHRAGDGRVGGPRRHPHARHRGDARQRLAAESQRPHGLEILDAADLARRVARERQHQLVGRNAGAVVADAAQRGAAALDLDLDRARAGVEAVLDEFLDHGRRALDDFAGGDLVDQLFGKDPDGHVGRTATRGRCARITNRGQRSASVCVAVPPPRRAAASAAIFVPGGGFS